MKKHHPHPGELLREDVLTPLGIEITDVAQRLGMSRTSLSRVINGHAGISPDLGVRLAPRAANVQCRIGSHKKL